MKTPRAASRRPRQPKARAADGSRCSDSRRERNASRTGIGCVILRRSGWPLFVRQIKRINQILFCSSNRINTLLCAENDPCASSRDQPHVASLSLADTRWTVWVAFVKHRVWTPGQITGTRMIYSNREELYQRCISLANTLWAFTP